MLNEQQKQVAYRALREFGYVAQTIKAIEELAELQVELSKCANAFYRGEIVGKSEITKVLVEMADVYIMLEQIKHFFDCGGTLTLKKHIKLKTKRLETRLNERQGL